MSEISKTADKALAVLAELAAVGEASPQQLARQLNLNRTVIQRLLTTLLRREFVTARDGRYRLAPLITRLADAVQPTVRRAASTHADALASQVKETVVFQMLDGDAIVVLHEARPAQSVGTRARHEVGSRSSLTLSASGQAILAALTPAVRDGIVASSGDPDLSRRLDMVRDTGYSTTSGSLQNDVTGLAVAVRHDDHPIGSLAIIVPTSRAEDLPSHLPRLQRAALRIERDLSQKDA